MRDPVSALVRRHHRGLGALDQQGPEVVVPTFGDAPEPVLAAAGVLRRHQTQPGAELRATLELLEVAHAGTERRTKFRWLSKCKWRGKNTQANQPGPPCVA